MSFTNPSQGPARCRAVLTQPSARQHRPALGEARTEFSKREYRGTSCTGIYRRRQRRQLPQTAALPYKKIQTANLPLMMRGSGFRKRRGGCTRPSPGQFSTTRRRSGMSGFASGMPPARSGHRPISSGRYYAANMAGNGSALSWTGRALNGGATCRMSALLVLRPSLKFVSCGSDK